MSSMNREGRGTTGARATMGLAGWMLAALTLAVGLLATQTVQAAQADQAARPGEAAAAAWPARPVRLIVPYAVGGVADSASRLLADQLRVELGQSVVVENRPGGGATMGIDQMARSAPDGYTVAFTAVSPLTLVPHLQKVPYDAVKDVIPVAQVMYSPIYLVTASSYQARNFAELIADAKSRPGELNFATSGVGSVGQIMLEQIAHKAAVRFNHIPYKGGSQVAIDAAGGQFDVFTTNPNPTVNSLLAQGKLRVLAVAAPERLPSFPDVPTLLELGYPEANLASVFGVVAPAGVPAPIVERLNAAINRVLGSKEVSAKLSAADNVVSPGTPVAFGERLAAESKTNAEIISVADIRVE